MSIFKTSVGADGLFDSSRGDRDSPQVSEFLTLQSLTNFSAMTGAGVASWGVTQKIFPGAGSYVFPFLFAVFWGAISFVMSSGEIFREKPDGGVDWAKVAGTFFIAFVNSLVLAGAIIGASEVSASDQQESDGYQAEHTFDHPSHAALNSG